MFIIENIPWYFPHCSSRSDKQFMKYKLHTVLHISNIILNQG